MGVSVALRAEALPHRSEFRDNDTMNSDRSGIPHGVLEERRRQAFLRGLADDFARLRGREATWHDENEERSAWNHTLADDLESE